MFDEKKLSAKVAPADWGRFLFERRSGMRDWETGVLMPAYVGKITPIVGIDEMIPVVPVEPEQAPEISESIVETPTAEEPKKRGRPAKSQ